MYARPTGTARKKRKAALVWDEALASDPATSSAGSELEHGEGGHASGSLSEGNSAMGEHVVESQIREEQTAIDSEQGVGIGGDSMQVGRQFQGDYRQDAGSTSYEIREVGGDQAAGYDNFNSDVSRNTCSAPWIVGEPD